MTSTFHDFSHAFDELRSARKAWEAYGEARHEKMPPAGVWTAKRAYDEALKRYDAIVAALVDPELDKPAAGQRSSTAA